jgi:hypothetical protein
VWYWLLYHTGGTWKGSVPSPWYNEPSGFVGCLGLFASAIAISFHAAASYRHKNCHVHRCWRIGRHRIGGTPYVVCRKHHPGGAPTHEEVIAAHEAAAGKGESLMSISRLSIDGTGRVTGTCPNGRQVEHNSPWPCPNGDWGGMGVRSQIRGFLPHTMVGNLPGTQSEFNNRAFQASAHFLVDQAGQIVQMGPAGPGRWKAWAEAAGNVAWFSAEFADDGNPDNPFTAAQIQAAAQLAELLARPDVGNFPLQVTNSTGGLGVGVHNMGGIAWGGHSCPDEPPEHVRSNQRSAIVALAQQLRGAGPNHVPPVPPVFQVWTTAGQLSLAVLAAQLHTQAATICRMTCEHSPGAVFPNALAAYIDAVFAADQQNMGAGLTWWYVSGRADKEWTTNPGDQPLSALATQLGNQISVMIRMTAERGPGAVFAGNVASYVNGVFARSSLHVPEGIHLIYP